MMDRDKLGYLFTPQVLETIMDKNLALYQYCDHLLPILKREVMSQPKESPEDSSSMKKVQRSRQQHIQYSFPLDLIKQGLASKQFIQKLHPYVNSLFTTTNIGIVRQTLKIYMLMETNTEKFKALHRIKETVNILTLYQVDKNVTFLLGEINNLNSIFCKIGLIMTRSQFEFYNTNIWKTIPEEQVDLGYSHRGKKIVARYLQIYDLLPLAVEMEQIKIVKLNLRTWMNNEQFEKFNAKRIKILREKARLESKQYVDENMDIIRLRIQHLTPEELLREIQIRGYDIQKLQHRFASFREQLMELQSQEEKKKEPNSISSKSTIFNSQEGKQNKKSSKPVDYFSKAPSNRQKLEQQAFNLKVLNGCFVRMQIQQDLAQGNVQFVDNYGLTDEIQKQDFLNQTAQTTKFGLQRPNIQNLQKDEVLCRGDKLNKKISDSNTKIIGDHSSGTQTPSSICMERKINGGDYRQKVREKIKGELFFGISKIVFKN